MPTNKSIEEMVFTLLRMARLHPCFPSTPDGIARGILGRGYLVRVPRAAIGAPGALVLDGNHRVIFVAYDVVADELPAVVAHELGELVLRVHALQLTAQERERMASDVACALVDGMPRRRRSTRE